MPLEVAAVESVTAPTPCLGSLLTLSVRTHHFIAERHVAEYHFVEEYELHLDRLCAHYPIDEAMSLAVGGDYDRIGEIERDILLWAGLKRGKFLIDLGCGSGRLAAKLAEDINYTGLDVVQRLLDYAAEKAPRHFHFLLNRDLKFPLADNSTDFISAFSVFTHLLHSESFLYIEDAKRVLKPGGRLIFSFLEFASEEHWQPFVDEVETRRHKATNHLNSLIERPVISIWAKKLGYDLEQFIDYDKAPWGTGALGQTIAILRS